jgi:hypothetical protein
MSFWKDAANVEIRMATEIKGRLELEVKLDEEDKLKRRCHMR